MVAYIVFTCERLRDPEPLEMYRERASTSLAGHSVTLRAVRGRHQVLEGAAIESVTILEFPTFDEAKAWYESPAYQEARKHRFAGADYRAVIVEGR